MLIWYAPDYPIQKTTDLPKKCKSPVTNLNNWPRPVQLAYVLCDDNGVKQTEANHIIKPEGFIIPGKASAIHGISGKRALREGKPLFSVLNSFASLIRQDDILFAHNMSFDEKVVGVEFLRCKVNQNPVSFLTYYYYFLDWFGAFSTIRKYRRTHIRVRCQE